MTKYDHLCGLQDALRQHFKARLGPNVAWGGRRVVS